MFTAECMCVTFKHCKPLLPSATHRCSWFREEAAEPVLFRSHEGVRCSTSGTSRSVSTEEIKWTNRHGPRLLTCTEFECHPTAWSTSSCSRDMYQQGILKISQNPTACKPRAELARHPAACARYSRTQMTVLLPWYACMPASLQGSHLVTAAAPIC
jgi:hypothetical protein